MDNTKIRYIEQASWFKTMEHYPKTIGHAKLLVSILDKVGIFNEFNLSVIGMMESKRLNILYAVLRIMNNVFNKYLDKVVKIFFGDIFKQMFEHVMTDTDDYELLLDQLMQDVDHFVCLMIKSYYPLLSASIIKIKFVEHLKVSFQKSFYENLFKKYGITETLYDKHNELFTQMSNEFVKITSDSLDQTHKSMKLFADRIFSLDCSYQTIVNIMNLIESRIDTEKLFYENSMEIDIYSEQKLNDECSSKQKQINKFVPRKQKILNRELMDN